MIYYFIYFLFSPLFFIAIYIGSLFNKKIYKHLKNQKKLFKNLIAKINNLDRSKTQILMLHAASAGEFEQLQPILKNINKEKYFIIQTFTSPTIYDKEKNNKLFDFSCYHPFDIWWQSFSFFCKIKPDIYVITRHDLWPGHILFASIFKSKTFYINANIHSKSIWLKIFIRPFSRFIFKHITQCLVPSESIATLAQKVIQKNKIIITGDTRFDQIFNRHLNNKNKKYLPDSFLKSFNIIFGSYDDYDEQIILKSLITCYPRGSEGLKEMNHKIILVPHEVEDKNIKKISTYLYENKFNPILFSNIHNYDEINNVLIVDKVGILADLYKYSTLAYIGAGFRRGVHSVIEPAIYGCVVSFGPNIEILDEAKYIYKKELGFMIKNQSDMNNFLKLYKTKEKINKLSKGIKKYILANKNVSKKVLQIIED